MAICNAIGSNIFDILIGLGVPWLFKSLITLTTIGGSIAPVAVQSTALPVITLTLLTSTFALIITFKLAKWQLGLFVGFACTIIYLVFITISILLEIKIF